MTVEKHFGANFQLSFTAFSTIPSFFSLPSSSPVTFHSFTTLSIPALANLSPLQCQDILSTCPRCPQCPANTAMLVPVCTFHRRMDSSLDDESSSHSLVGQNCKSVIASLCPSRVRKSERRTVSMILITPRIPARHSSGGPF